MENIYICEDESGAVTVQISAKDRVEAKYLYNKLVGLSALIRECDLLLVDKRMEGYPSLGGFNIALAAIKEKHDD